MLFYELSFGFSFSKYNITSLETFLSLICNLCSLYCRVCVPLVLYPMSVETKKKWRVPRINFFTKRQKKWNVLILRRSVRHLLTLSRSTISVYMRCYNVYLSFRLDTCNVCVNWFSAGQFVDINWSSRPGKKL